MFQTAADVLMDSLCDWGVEIIFGLPGDGINGIMEALRQRKEKIRFIQVRHEEAAAFMACGYAKYSGKLGVCLATSGPGGLHLLNGLYDAKLDRQPVLAITGLAYHDLLNTFAQQDVNLDRVFEDVTVYNARIMGPEHVEAVTDLACRTALSYRGVAHIAFPVDFQSMKLTKKRSKRNVPHHTSDVCAFGARLPHEEDLKRAAQVLNNGGSKIAILAGQGALHAGDELEHVADLLGAPIVKALLGKGAVPDQSPFTTGGIGLLGTRPSQEIMEKCDTLLMVGTSFPYMEFLPKPGQAKAIQIDLDPMRIGLRYPVEIGLVADSKRALESLIPLLNRREDRSFLNQAQENMKEWRKLVEVQGTNPSKPMKPQVVAWELGKRLSETAIISADSGTCVTWFARQIASRREQKCSVSGNLASMGCGVPYAIAAQIAFPERQSIAFVGDGAFTMLMGELATCVKYKLPVKIVILKNNTLGMIKWEQMVFLGHPEFGCELEPIDFVGVARAFGASGFRIDDPKECGAILDEALRTPGPVVIEAVVDPFEPPMPPKVTLDQAKNFAESLIRGEPNREKIALTVIADKVRELT